MNLSGVVVLLFGISAIAQDKPEKPLDSFTGPAASWIVATTPLPQYANWSDKITKDGHYIAALDDPNNEYRCSVVSYLDSDARNVMYSDITSFTVVCTKKHEPQHE